ncbi:MAG: HlyD family efflux transporter periplasmic adaptor subunit, partial [Verrucomicrobiota bacterium]
MKPLRVILQIVGVLLVLGAAAGAAWFFLKTSPTTTPKEEGGGAKKVVQVIELSPSNERIVVTSWGSVVPAQEVSIRPQVSGRVIELNDALVLGGRIDAGQQLLEIDPADYEHAHTEKEADLEDAKFELEVERGQQAIAKREWEQLRADIPDADANPSLALREPHLRKAEAMVAKAMNAVARAKLDIDRTKLHAPFNCMIVAESVEIGQLIENGNDVCQIVGTDAFCIRATLPFSDLKRIQLPDGNKPGAAAD